MDHDLSTLADCHAFITRGSPFGHRIETWHRKRKEWVRGFPADNPPYANLTSAAREMDRMQTRGIIPMNYLHDTAVSPRIEAQTTTALRRHMP